MERYPFQLSATSLTDPMRSLAENIQLNRQFDLENVEVTLEYPRSLPLTDALKEEMLRYRNEGVGYTIHLPLSLRMTDVNPYIRDASLKTLEEIFRGMEEIDPRAYVLHVTPIFKTGGTPLGRPFDLTLHQDRVNAAWESLGRLAEIIDPKKIAVENLFDEFTFIDEIIKEFDFSVCMDVGHLLLNKADPYLFYHRYRDRIKVIHLHDVVNGRDHQQLGETGSTLDLKALFYLLKRDNYEQTIVLEQFKTEHIWQSLDAIAGVWKQL